MKYLVAVSGGIDSVVLLDMLVARGMHDITVAHFDHGIRPDSQEDARFVEGLSKKYGLPFISKREELGMGASEDVARTRRYAFLNEEAKKLGAIIVTAHHSDDVIETVAINLTRGTGWRGVAVLGNQSTIRPLLHITKADIRKYALDKKLEWAEDSTNMTGDYLRNRLRRKITTSLPAGTKQRLLELWSKQLELRREIDKEQKRLIPVGKTQSRYFLTMIDSNVAEELLRAMIATKIGTTCTRPQAARALLAIKTAKPGTIFEIGAGQKLHFNVDTFTIQTH